MKAPHAADASALPQLPGHSGVPHVFVVEYEPDIAAVLVDYLRAQVGTVSCFADGETALAAIRSPVPGQPRPDLVLLDVMLPGLDGLAVLRAVRATLDVPVVLVTARVEELDRLLGLNLRRKLAEAQGQTRADGRQEWIRSVYGVGFVFEPDF